MIRVPSILKHGLAFLRQASLRSQKLLIRIRARRMASLYRRASEQYRMHALGVGVPVVHFAVGLHAVVSVCHRMGDRVESPPRGTAVFCIRQCLGRDRLRGKQRSSRQQIFERVARLTRTSLRGQRAVHSCPTISGVSDPRIVRKAVRRNYPTTVVWHHKNVTEVHVCRQQSAGSTAAQVPLARKRS